MVSGMKGFELTPKQVVHLRMLHKKQKDRREAYKINAVILLGTGWTLKEVSEALLLDDETIRNYVKKYRDGKLDKLLELNYKGRPSRLSKDQKVELKAHLIEYTYTDVKSIIHYVKNIFGVSYKYSGMRKVLHSLGFRYKKPKLVPGKSDPIEAMKFLSRYEKIRRSGSPVYFADGVHPQHNSRPAYGWIMKGDHKGLLSNTGRKRVNINGAVNIDTKKLHVNIDSSVNAQSTIKLFKKILKNHDDDEKIYIICDNAGYYRCTLVKEFLEKEKRIELVFLPPYSPFLNLIERVWKYFNKIVLYNKYYATYDQFREACANFFKRSHKRALNKCLVEKFHFADDNLSLLRPISLVK